MKRLPGIYMLFTISVIPLFGQEDANQKTLSPLELKQDIAELRKALERYHPGLYWYTSKGEFDYSWDSLYQHVDQPLTEIDFFKLLLPVVAKVMCGHTLFYPSVSIMSNGSRFPIDIKLMDEKVYLWSDSLNAYDVPKGSELISINDKPIQVVLNQLVPNLQAQGGNKGWKKVILENDFQNYYHYIIEETDQFLIRYVNADTGQEDSRLIKGSSEETLRRHWKNWYPLNDGAPLKIEFRKNVAIITVKSLVRGRLKIYNQDAEKLFDEFFLEIQKRGVQMLIIDVRGNEGGNNPENLYSHIALPNSRNPQAKRDEKNAYIIPDKDTFTGQVVVLANERSISAQETFVSIFKINNRGFLVGQATPGCFKGLCSGKKHKRVLKNSKLEISIPMHASPRNYDTAVDFVAGQGFQPDFKIDTTVKDLLENKDVTKEFALKLIPK